MKPTVYQRVHLFVWHASTGGVDDSYLRKLYDAGARVINVQLQDDGPLPRSLVERWKAMGYRVWGVVWPGAPGGMLWTPTEAADFIASEKRRLALDGIRLNAEDPVESADGWGMPWSRDFVREFRERNPRLPAMLDTYRGARGMDLDAYREAGFRLTIQTYDGFGLWRDPPTSFVSWTGARGWPRSYVRPSFAVHKRDGQRLGWRSALADAKRAGTVGMTLYYVDGAFDVLDEMLVPMVREAIAMGVAR